MLARSALVALLFAAPVTAAAAASPSGAPGQRASGQPAAAVQETDRLQFEPMSVSVARGDVVEWTNRGSIPHNVTFDRYPSLSSGTMNGGDTYEIRFTTPGTYPYRCTFHPGMDGTVTVSG